MSSDVPPAVVPMHRMICGERARPLLQDPEARYDPDVHLIAILDDLFVGLDVSIAVQMQATPLAWLIAIGAVVVGSVVLTAALCVLMTAAATFAGELAPATGRGPRARHERLSGLATRRRRTVKARGARAPGRQLNRKSVV